MNYIIYVSFILILIISGCSESTNTIDSDTKDAIMLPSTVGTYWINTNVVTNLPPDNSPIESRRYQDSVYVVSNEEYMGKLTTKFVRNSKEFGNETKYYYQNGTELHEFSEGLPRSFILLNKHWIKLVDYKSNSWKPFPDTMFVNSIEYFNDKPALSNGTLKAMTVKSGSVSVTIDEKNYTATEFTTTFAFDLSITFVQTGITYPLKFNVLEKILHVKDLGIVSTVFDGLDLNTGFGKFSFLGFQTTLLRFKINP